MLKIRTIIFLLLSCFTLNVASGQIKTPVKWSFDKKQVSDTEFDIIFKAKIDDGWHVYSQFLESDEGPVATSFNFEEIKGYEIVGKAKEEGNLHKKFSKLFGMNLAYFDNHATFTQRVKLTGPSAKATGYLEFMTCDNVQCLPPTPVDFDFTLTSGAGAKPKPTPTPEPTPESKPPTTQTKPQVQPTPPPQPIKKPIDGSLFPGKKDGGTSSIQTQEKPVPVPVIPPQKQKPVVQTTSPPKKKQTPTQEVAKKEPQKPVLGKGKPVEPEQKEDKLIAQTDVPPIGGFNNLAETGILNSLIR